MQLHVVAFANLAKGLSSDSRLPDEWQGVVPRFQNTPVCVFRRTSQRLIRFCYTVSLSLPCMEVLLRVLHCLGSTVETSGNVALPYLVDKLVLTLVAYPGL